MRSKLLGLVCAAALIALPLTASAAGTVSGVVIDGLTGQPVRGATLAVEGTDLRMQSDIGGAFQATAEAGTYSVVVTKDGFEPQRITDLTVVDGEVADFAVVLLPSRLDAEGAGESEVPGDAAFAGEITVTAEAEASTEAALLAERKGAAGISDAIGAQEMSKNTGSDAAGVLQRVTGISLQNDKYVFVRGLGERYSNTSLNGSRLPTTEFDKKVVPLDLFPASLLEKVTVSKSYQADQPGDFAAGLVELETLDFPVEPALELSLGADSNSLTTGEAFGEYAGGLSFSGAGGQPMPGGIPDGQLRRSNPFLPGGYTPEELETFGESFVGEWTPESMDRTYTGAGFDDAPYGQDMSLTYGATFGRFGVVVSGTHTHDYAHLPDDERTFYVIGAGGDLQVAKDYDFITDSENVRRGLVGNLNYRFSPNHKVELRTLYTDDATAESRFFTGFNDDASTDVRNYRVRYQDEEILSTQLSGEHFFEAVGEGGLLEWRGTTSEATQDENLRESLYRQEGEEFVLVQESQSAFLMFNDLEDTVDEYAVDWTQFFTAAEAYGSVKGGFAFSGRDRDFSSRRFRYTFRGTTGLDLTLLPEQLLVPENIGPNGFEIREETRATDFYTASHEVTGAYAMADFTFGQWRVIGGVRGEQSEQEVVTFDPHNPEADQVVSTLDDDAFMPSLSVVRRIGDTTNLRAAFSQTVNRPEFRELAPFEFTDVIGGRSSRGNPDLVNATITSYDLRWEWFPNQLGVVAASLFYKDFTDPIERTLLIATELQSTWRNADSAENFGAELEFRRDLGFLSSGLQPFTLQLNYTWVSSEVTISDNEIITNPSRPLVGQPDQVYNVVLEWVEPSWGTTTRLLYNYTGEKVFEGGAFGIPDVLEEPVAMLDFVWRQDLAFLADGLGAKLSLTNLTDEQIELTGGYARTYKPGRGVGLSLSYTPF